jgi:hypothetical protein
MAPQAATLLYALDGSRGVWLYSDSKKKWARVPDLRQ